MLLQNKLFVRIIIVFTIPILGILYFGISTVYNNINRIEELQGNNIRLEYIKTVADLMISLEKEKLLSMEQLNAKKVLTELQDQQEVSKLALKNLKFSVDNLPWKDEWKVDYLHAMDINFSTIEKLRDNINNFLVTNDKVMLEFNFVNKKGIKRLLMLQFKDFISAYSHNILALDSYFDSNKNQIDVLSSILDNIIISIEDELFTVEQKRISDRNLSILFIIFCFFTLIPLFFIIRVIILNEQKIVFRIEQYQNLYKFLHTINKYLVKIPKQDDLYEELCELLNEHKDLLFCAVYDSVNDKVFGQKNEFRDLLQERLSSNFDTVSKVIKRGESFVKHKFEKDDESLLYDKVEEFNIRSMAIFPIKKFDQSIGALGLFSKIDNFFDQEIEILFSNFIFDISSCLEKIDYELIKSKQEKELKLAAYAFDSSSPMIITDAKNKIVQVNNAFCEIMGYSKQELIGQNPQIFETNKDEEVMRKLKEKLKINGTWSGIFYNKKASGEIIVFQCVITAIKDNKDQIISYIAHYMDISKQKDREKILEYQATHDNLTGLPNRLLLLDRIERAITKAIRHKIFGGLIFIDLDNFKQVNDTLGHDIGDILLITVARKIEECLRQEDTVARVGGDEFIVLIDNIGNNSTDARKNMSYLASKIKDALNSITHIDGHINVSTPSIGITIFNDGSLSIQDLIKQADAAMYTAKKQKNSIEFF